MTSILHRHSNPRAACIFGTIGAVAGGFGFLLLVSVPFSSYYPWMILSLGSLAILVIFDLAFMYLEQKSDQHYNLEKVQSILIGRLTGH